MAQCPSLNTFCHLPSTEAPGVEWAAGSGEIGKLEVPELFGLQKTK